MANRYAVATGIWSNPATWDGGTLPQAGDVVRPNGFIVTIDQGITVDELTNNASAPAVAGGSFQVSSSVSITSDVLCRSTSTLLTLNGVGISVVISGNVDGNSAAAANGTAIVISTESTLTVLGDVLGGALTSTTAGASLNHGIIINAANVFVNVVGSVIGGGQNTGSGFNSGITSSSNQCTVNVTGLVQGSAYSAFNVKAAISLLGLNNILNITGIVYGNVSAAVVVGSSTSNVYMDGTCSTVGSNIPFNVARLVMLNGVIFCDVVNSLAGVTKFMIPPFSDVEIVTETEVVGVDNYLYTAGLLTGYPPEAKVEDGEVYGPSGEFTGELSPVNVNTAQLATDLFDAIIASSDPLAVRLKNTATVSTVNDAVASLNVIP
jgi:hypothetical protein